MKNVKFAVLSVLAIISVLVIRCIQLLFLVDTHSGFFADGMESVGTILSVLTVLIAAFTAVFGYFGKHPEIDYTPTSSWLFGGAALLIGISNLIEPFTMVTLSENVPKVLIILRAVAIFLAGCTFIYVAFTNIFSLKPRFGLMIIPVISFVLRLMVTFISFTGMSNIADNLYDVGMLATVLVFLLFHAKLLCGLKLKNPTGLLLSTGILSVLFTTAAILPRLLVSFSGTPEFLHTPIDSPVTCLLMACYIGIYMIQTARKSA